MDEGFHNCVDMQFVVRHRWLIKRLVEVDTI